MINWNEIETKGKKSGNIKTLCPACSHTRKKKKDPCLSVNLDKGLAKCWNCEDISVRDVKEPKKETVLPPQDWQNYTKLSDKMVKYMNEERGIRQETIIACKVTQEEKYFPQIQKKRQAIVFNYFEGSTLVNKKYKDAEKNFTQEKDAKKIFYGINDIVGETECFIVEGEMDKLAMYEAGFKNCISVPNGANDINDIFDTCETYLNAIETFIIGVDMDAPGVKLEQELIKRLGKHKCKRIHWKGKDANDDLLSGDLNESVEKAEYYPVEGTFTAYDISDELNDFYENGFENPLVPHGDEFIELNKCFSVLKGQLTVVTGIPTHGKALEINTPIPTPNGFVKMIDLKIGDIVFDENGEKCKVTWKSEVWENRPTYKLTFSDNSEIICDENHEWLTDTWKSRRSKLNAIKNDRLKNRDLKPNGNDQTYKRTFESVKTTKEISQTLKIKNDNRNNHSIKLCKSISLKSKKLEIPPYILGCWLGDGTSADAGFTTADKEIISSMRLLGYKVNKRADKYGYGIIGLKDKLRKYDLIKNKHIPVNYLFSSEKDRIQLLQGLMDTDGHCSKVEARCEYTGTNKELCENVYSLICSLGIKATFVVSDAKLNGELVSKKYRIFFKTNKKVFKLKRKQFIIDQYFKNRSTRGNDKRYITKCELVNGYKTQCIEVDSESHLFLAGYQFIPTHNSNWLEWYLLNLINDNALKLSLFSPEHLPMKLHHSVLAEKVIGKPFHKDLYQCKRMTLHDLQMYKEWSNEKVYLTSPEVGQSPTWKWLLDTFKQQIFRYGVDMFVIDAFNKVKRKNTDSLGEINDILAELTLFCQQYNVNVFLIAHPTKMRKKDDNKTFHVPTLYDVKGSGDFYDQTHNGLTVYRDFDLKETIIIPQKLKFKHQGEVGIEVFYNYQIQNGRYKPLNQKENNESIIRENAPF